jgi:hypothetical protein
MPWKECSVTDERIRFVARLLEGDASPLRVRKAECVPVILPPSASLDRFFRFACVAHFCSLLSMITRKNDRVSLKRFQERDKVVRVLLRKMKVESCVVEMDNFQQRGGGAVMEVGSTPRQPAQDRSFDFSNMVELAIDQSLAEICRGFAVVARPT